MNSIPMDTSLIGLVRRLLYPPESLSVRPLGTKFFNYRIVPEKIRIAILQFIARNKIDLFDNTLANHSFEDLWTVLSSQQKEEVYNVFHPLRLQQKYVVLTHDVESIVGADNLLEIAKIEESFDFRSSWNFTAFSYRWDRGLLSYLKETGHEIGLHGFYHDTKLHTRKSGQLEALFKKASDNIESFGIKGGRVPSWFVDRSLLRIFSSYFTYDMSLLDREMYDGYLPRGCGCLRPYRIGSIVEIPTNILFDKFYIFKRRDVESDKYWTQKAQRIAGREGIAVSLMHVGKAYCFGKRYLSDYKQFLYNLYHDGFKTILPSQIVEMMNVENRRER